MPVEASTDSNLIGIAFSSIVASRGWEGGFLGFPMPVVELRGWEGVCDPLEVGRASLTDVRSFFALVFPA